MTIDINKLRKLAQAALAGPDGISLNWVKLLQDFQQKASPAAVIELLDRLEAAESEAIEQARLNGMGSERELALMAKLEAAERERDEVAQHLVQSERGKRKISEECDALRAEVESWKSLAAQFGRDADEAKTHLAFAKDELNRLRSEVIHWKEQKEPGAAGWRAIATTLRARIEAMEKQEPSVLVEAIIADMQAQYNSEMITENDSGEALIRLDGAIAAVEDNFAGAQTHHNEVRFSGDSFLHLANLELAPYRERMREIAASMPTVAEQDQINAEAAIRSIYGAQPAPSEQDASVRKAWARFSHELHRSPDAPYPGMSDAFEQHFSQSFTEREWRAEASTWAAAWKAAKRHCAQPALSVPDDVVEQAVNRFLSWKLPKDFHPDGGTVFIPTKGRGYDSPHWPIGTNLLNAQQAREMLRYVLAAAAQETKP